MLSRRASSSRPNSSRRCLNCAFDSRNVASARRSSVAAVHGSGAERSPVAFRLTRSKRLARCLSARGSTHLRRADGTRRGMPRAAGRRPVGTLRPTWPRAPYRRTVRCELHNHQNHTSVRVVNRRTHTCAARIASSRRRRSSSLLQPDSSAARGSLGSARRALAPASNAIVCSVGVGVERRLLVAGRVRLGLESAAMRSIARCEK